MDINNDEYYIKQVLKGKTSEYAFLVDKYKNMVFNLALKITDNRENAEEVAQDVFIKAYQGLSGFQATSKFSTWIYSITYNHSISFLRKKQLNTCSMDDFGALFYETYGETDYQFANLDCIPPQYATKALENLDKPDQIVLTLYYQNASTVKEISDITGLSSANVKIRLFRGRKKLLYELKKIFKLEMADLL